MQRMTNKKRYICENFTNADVSCRSRSGISPQKSLVVVGKKVKVSLGDHKTVVARGK